MSRATMKAQPLAQVDCCNTFVHMPTRSALILNAMDGLHKKLYCLKKKFLTFFVFVAVNNKMSFGLAGMMLRGIRRELAAAASQHRL